MGCIPAFRAAETLTGGAHKGVFVREPLEVFAAPDAGVGMAEAGRWDEGRGTSVFQLLVVEGGPVLRVSDHLRDRQAAEPPVLSEHVCEIVFVRRRPGARHDGRHHLAARACHREMRLIGEMAAERWGRLTRVASGSLRLCRS